MQGVINVSGKAQIQKAPDQARVHFKLKTNGQTASLARDMTNVTTEVLKETVKQFAGTVVERETRLEHPIYKYDHTGTNEPEFLHYESVMNIHIKTNVEHLGQLLDLVLTATSSTPGLRQTLSVDGVTFDLSTKKQLENQLLGEAARSAHDKALVVARSLHLEVSEILEISESGNSYDFDRPRFAPMSAMNERAASMRVAPTNIEPGLLTFEAAVNMKVSVSKSC